MRPAAYLGRSALATAMGAVLVGELVVVPGLANQAHLVDANLATALTGPLHLRIADIVLAATVVLAAIAPRWLGSRLATAAALLTVATAAVYRLVLPAAYGAWSRVDRVAGRPVDRLLEAERLTDQAHWMALSLLLLLLGLTWLATAQPSAQPSSQPLPSTATPAAPRSEQPLSASC
jgi:hypothetical protein